MACHLGLLGDRLWNWGASFLTNDVYKGYFRPEASDRTLAGVSKLTTILMVTVSFLVALFLVDRMMSWFLYFNSVMVAFILALAWLRFFWWRLNIWGEAAGILLGLPLGYLIWFPLGFSHRPFWQAFFVFFGAGWAVILLVTLVTPPESIETLRRFYARCGPSGFWAPVASSFSPIWRQRLDREFRHSLANGAIGVSWCLGLILLFNACFAGSGALIVISGSVVATFGIAFGKRWRSATLTGRLASEGEPDEAWIADPGRP